MKFRFPLLNSLFDAQQNFEALEGRDILDLTGESVLQLLSTGTQRQIAFGSGAVTFPGAAPDSNTLTVTHGLGRTPIFASAVGNFTGTGGLTTGSVFFACGTFGSTTFATRGSTPGANQPLNATANFNWIAIG